LADELDLIESQRESLALRAQAIRQLLGGDLQPSLLGDQITNGGESPPAVAPQPPLFKTAVSTVIRERPGIKVPEVTRELRHRKWLPNGRTDLGHRVYNEIWRMLSRGEVRKTANGGYEVS
jgi:hypothetical protein